MSDHRFFVESVQYSTSRAEPSIHTIVSSTLPQLSALLQIRGILIYFFFSKNIFSTKPYCDTIH